MQRRGYDEHRCTLPTGEVRTLPWIASPSSRQRNLPGLLRDVLESAARPDRGPILIHCWNGLHYAGMVAALVLRQLCGFSTEEAEAYWWATTRQGADYPHVIRRIRRFHPLPGFALTDEQRQRLCPAADVAHADRARGQKESRRRGTPDHL
jgi:hypothetical protein